MKKTFNDFGNNLIADSLSLNDSEAQKTATAEIAPIVLNPANLPDYYGDMLEVTSDSIRLLDEWYPREGHTFILSGKDWMNAGKYLVILTTDFASLPRLGQLVPHYGKYSYLVFNGARNIGKGQWPIASSPLKKSLVMTD